MHVYLSGLMNDLLQEDGWSDTVFAHSWHLSPFCLYIKQDIKRHYVCVRSKALLFEALREGGDKPLCGHCPFGMLEVTWPVMVQGKLVGAVGAGMYRGDESVVMERLSNAQRRYGLSFEEMLALYEQSAMPRGALQIAAESQLPIYADALSAWTLQGRLDLLPNTTKVHGLVAKALHYIHIHARDEMTVPRIAMELNVSESYLQHLFQRIRGRSVVRTIQDTRLDWARQIIADGRLSITETARACGFADPNYFSTVFTKRFGVPPSRYRRQLLVRKNED